MVDVNICYIRPFISLPSIIHLFMNPSFSQKDYPNYLESGMQQRWLRPEIFYEVLKLKLNNSCFETKILGLSTEKRDILNISWGKGPIKILCWSQMHGNEPTASLAILDLLNFLSASDSYNQLRKSLSEKITVVIVPMLNPDGAEQFIRRNAVNIDLNRDAASRCSVEMKLFLDFVEELKPDWAFNLHDQRNIFSAGNTKNTATISYLAASADIERSVTTIRLQSMKLIAALAENTVNNIGAHVGRYADEFYPRALGEYFHKSEIPCVLIESGAFARDYTRAVARKQNFLGLLYAFELISEDEYNTKNQQDYESIPLNHQNLYDLIIRDCTFIMNDFEVKMDLALLIQEQPNTSTKQLDLSYVLTDIGDLNFHFGLEEQEGGSIQEKQKLEIGKEANFHIIRENNTDLLFIKGKLQ